MYLRLEIGVVCRKFLPFKNKSDDYLNMYIKNIENSRLTPVFGTQYKFEFLWAGIEFLMDIVESKNRC